MKTTGHYYKSAKEASRAGWNLSDEFLSRMPSMSATGSVRGMRKMFWGYDCSVVKIGAYIYKLEAQKSNDYDNWRN